MIDALRFEVVRLRTVRSTYWLIGLALLFGSVMAVAVSIASRGGGDNLAAADQAGLVAGGVALVPLLPLTAVMMGILGVLAVGHEYRHSTIRPTLTALPHRSSLVAAKLAVVGLVSAAVAVVSMALNYLLIMLIRGQAPEIDASGRAGMVGYVALIVGWGLIGVAATLLTRQTALVLPLLFVVPLIVENLIQGLSVIPQLDWLRPAVPYLPFGAGLQLAQTYDVREVLEGLGGPQPLTRLANAGVFFGFIALVLAPAWLLFEKRDA